MRVRARAHVEAALQVALQGASDLVVASRVTADGECERERGDGESGRLLSGKLRRRSAAARLVSPGLPIPIHRRNGSARSGAQVHLVVHGFSGVRCGC
jgi:hypothetical protein